MVLDASGNAMGGTEIEPLLDLYRLETLNLADNDVEEMAQVRRNGTKGMLPVPYSCKRIRWDVRVGFWITLHANAF